MRVVLMDAVAWTKGRDGLFWPEVNGGKGPSEQDTPVP